MKKNRLHDLLTHNQKKGFLQNLNLSTEDEASMIYARDVLVKAISSGFDEAREKARRQGKSGQIPKPRFAMQGSRVYKTLNAPAYPPKQQVDIDLGVYLPFSALGNGMQPEENVTLYFDVMENLLNEFLKGRPNNTWTLNTGKKTCLRIQVTDYIHIDLPLYAAPEEEMDRVRKAMQAEQGLLKEGSIVANDANFFDAESSYISQVDPTVIHMAHRQEGWLPSDALIIRDWVLNSCKAKGINNAVRPVCRYLKGWRDEAWPNGGGPSSIFLLAFVIEHYEAVSNYHCDLLEIVINKLPEAFQRPLCVPCPTPENFDAKEDLRNRVDDSDQLSYTKAFENLKRDYANARNNTCVDEVNIILQKIFGARLPRDADRIVKCEESMPKAKKIVRKAKPRVEPLITTPTSTSG